MLRHLRLARARGSLTAPNSPVQDLALEMLLLLDDRKHQDARLDMLKHSMLQTPPPDRAKLALLFPEFVPAPDPFEEATKSDGSVDIDKIDDAALDWAVPSSPLDDDEISAWIASRETGSLSAAELDDGWK